MSALRIASRNDISEVPGERTAGLRTCGTASADVATIPIPLEQQLIHVADRVAVIDAAPSGSVLSVEVDPLNPHHRFRFNTVDVVGRFIRQRLKLP
jgi:hypothetical protein